MATTILIVMLIAVNAIWLVAFVVSVVGKTRMRRTTVFQNLKDVSPLIIVLLSSIIISCGTNWLNERGGMAMLGMGLCILPGIAVGIYLNGGSDYLRRPRR